MFEEKPSNYSLLVEENRVHKSVYYDPEIFDAEMEHIWGRAWIFIGHDSQVPNKGDFYTTEIGHVPVVMVRGNNEEVHVLHNRCGHKGAKVAGKNVAMSQAFDVLTMDGVINLMAPCWVFPMLEDTRVRILILKTNNFP